MSNIILLDIDDTSGDLKSKLQEMYRKETGDKSIHYSQWDTFAVANRYGITDDRLFEMFLENSLLETIEPHVGLSEVTQELQERGYRIEIVTARAWHPNAYSVTKEWLNKHEVGYTNINIVPLDKCKEEATRELGPAKLFIDDRFDHCASMAASGRVEQCLLFSQPWNAASTLEKRIDKIHSLYDVLNFI